MIKKIYITVFCLLCGAAFAFAQPCEDMLQKKTIALNMLEIEKDNLSKQLEDKQKEYAKLKSEYDALVDLNKQAAADKRALDSIKIENTRLNATLKIQDTKIEALQKDTAKLKTENRRLEEEITRHENTIKQEKTEKSSLSSENEQHKRDNGKLSARLEQLERDTAARNDEIQQCKAEKSDLRGKNKQLETEKLNLTNERDGLQRDKSTLISEKAALQTEITTLKGSNTQLTAENKNLKSSLSGTIKSMVHSVTNGTAYESGKADEAIAICDGASAYLAQGEASALVAKLKQFKTLCLAIEEARKVLDKAFNQAAADQAIRGLDASQPFNQLQTADKNNYKNLIREYCDKTKYCAERAKNAENWLPDHPNKTVQDVKEIQKNVDERYTYLHKELNLKKNTPGYRCKFSASCN